jgi:hypothetical protein
MAPFVGRSKQWFAVSRLELYLCSRDAAATGDIHHVAFDCAFVNRLRHHDPRNEEQKSESTAHIQGPSSDARTYIFHIRRSLLAVKNLFEI